jgi:FKBP-type peptidyl-prolyl cis-trans isomerase SlyD
MNTTYTMMEVDDQAIVAISYELRDGHAQGPLLERMDPNWPFKFYFGSGKLLPAFEQQLRGLEEGQAFAFTLSPEEAYGPVEQGNIIDVPGRRSISWARMSSSPATTSP